jgi:cell fate regulator YaaT (PSP1 superfamily)
MPQIVGVRFECAGRVYYFAPGELSLEPNAWVVVETSQGLSLGQVVMTRRDVDEGELSDRLKPVVRLADSHDLLLQSYYASREPKALERCQERAVELGLDMQVLRAHYAFNGDRVTFYFTADERIDFRDLVREVARDLRTHVDMRQLGPRDELKLLKGWGGCGRPLCCATWMAEFSPISIRMAKAQDLPLSPESISGNCGRLCCCLKFEYDRYVQRDDRPVRRTESS